MAQEYRIEKQAERVFLLLREMDTKELWEGEVFFHEHAEFHSGPPLLEEFLNASAPFFPLHTADRGFCLINKENIIYIKCHIEAENPYEALGIEPNLVKVYFKEHHYLEGFIYPELPEDRRRPLDFFNQGIKFLPLFQGDQKVVMNTHHILHIQDSKT